MHITLHQPPRQIHRRSLQVTAAINLLEVQLGAQVNLNTSTVMSLVMNHYQQHSMVFTFWKRVE